MGDFILYLQQTLTSDIKSLWYSIGDSEFYPFFQYSRNALGSDKSLSENYNFILEFFYAILLIPILIVALLFWNIARAFPRGSSYARAFPSKVFDLALGKKRSDYFDNKTSGKYFEAELISRLKEIDSTIKAENMDVFDIVSKLNIDGIYSGGELSSGIKRDFSDLVDSFTRAPSKLVIDKITSFLNFTSKEKFTGEHTARTIRSSAGRCSQDINLSGHLWLYFFRHLYRSYFPWEELGLIADGKVNELFSTDGSIEDFLDEDGVLDSLTSYWSRGDYANTALSKQVNNSLLKAEDPSVPTIRKFALIWHIVKTLRSGGRLRNRSSYDDYDGESDSLYLENDPGHKRVYGAYSAPHENSICKQAVDNIGLDKYKKVERVADLGAKIDNASNSIMSAFSAVFKTTVSPTKDFDCITSNLREKDPERVFISDHIKQINSSEDPETTAREKGVIWLNHDYFFTGETISKNDYLSKYELNEAEESRAKDLPDQIPIIKKKNDRRELLQSNPPSLRHVLLAFPLRLLMALLITAVQVVVLAIQLVVCAVIVLAPIFNFCIYKPCSSKAGQCVLSIISTIASMLILIQPMSSFLSPVGFISNKFIAALVGLGWTASGAFSLFNTTVLSFVILSLAFSMYSFYNLNSVDVKHDRRQIAGFRKGLGLLASGLGFALLAYSAVLYPGLFMAPKAIAGLAAIMSPVIASVFIVAVVILAARFMLSEPQIKVVQNGSSNDSITLGDRFGGVGQARTTVRAYGADVPRESNAHTY
ncbi:MAG: hypothetical protein HON55_01180 [Legionellales bacterium]|jgi:hypothetical protein|nr:hypothetical protein [Legionellales bacterium]